MLHNSKMGYALALTLFCTFFSGIAQTPFSGFYPEKNTLTIAPSYSYKSIYSLYASYAVNNWLSTVITLPYIETKSQDGALDPILQTDVVDGVQDLGVFAKAKVYEKSFQDASKFSIGGATGVTLPVGDYEGAGVLSLGNQATTVNGAAILQYTTKINLFAEVQGGYSYRNSSDFDIPNAIMYGFKIGYFNEYFYLHANLEMQDSMSGLDIGTPEFAEAGAAGVLPETEVDFTNLSFNFYIPLYKQKLGISAGYATTLNGRNFSKENAFSFGLVYSSL